MSAPVKARSRIPRPASNHLSPTSVNSIFPASTSILIPLPGQRPNSAFMEGVKEEQSQKNNAKNQSKMMHPPAPQSSAPRAASPETAAPEVQVKTSQPPQPLRGATPPTSDALSPPSAHVPAEDAEDDDTDEGPTQEADEDETVHDLQAYDWTKLEDEYEAAMAQCDEKEKEATEEFKKLANYFAQWSSVSHGEDRERSAKRYKTREAHIMHSESEYQKKKEHFDKVVAAFKSAMELLQYT